MEIHHWSAWEFRKGNGIEIRIGGYLRENNTIRYIISAPVTGVDPVKREIHTTEGILVPQQVLNESSNRMDTMYNLGRWCQLQDRPEPTDVTKLVLNDLNEGKEDAADTRI